MEALSRLLELQLQRELNFSWGSRRTANDSKVCIRDGVIRIAEVGVIENVEEFAAELKREPLRERKILVGNEVQILQGGPGHVVPSFVAEGVRIGYCEGSSIEPFQTAL